MQSLKITNKSQTIKFECIDSKSSVCFFFLRKNTNVNPPLKTLIHRIEDLWLASEAIWVSRMRWEPNDPRCVD